MNTYSDSKVPKNNNDNEVSVCSISGGDHRYFIFKTNEVFEPYILDSNAEEAPTLLYKKTEYAIMGCNCGSAVKTVVRNTGL